MNYHRLPGVDSISSHRLIAWGAVLLSCSLLHAIQSTDQRTEFFESKIRPLLAQNCFQCHSGQANVLFAGLRLDTSVGLLKGGDGGTVIVPGNPDASRLIQAVRHENLQMPPTGKLSDDQIANLVKWVKMGAPWPDYESLMAEASPPKSDGGTGKESHWAWMPVHQTKPPEVTDADWASHPIDRFILARLETESLSPSKDADRYTLLRRVYLDLTGLPPSPEDVTSFAQNVSQSAFEMIVDRLLESPEFGERWARHWLDLTGYADNFGVGRRIPAREAWRYRDYVIRAFNDDKPYDRFVQEQVAGDVLEWETDRQRREQLVATGLLAIGPWALVDADKEQLRMDVVDNQIDTVGRAFLGLTLGCARCHDHKFDPVPTRDYYALAGIFRSTQTLKGRISGVFSDVNRRLLPETADELTQRASALVQVQKALTEARIQESTIESEKERLTDRKEILDKGEAELAEKERLEKEIEEVDKKLQEATHLLKFLEYNKPGPPMAIATGDRDEPENCRINIRGDPHTLGEEVPRGFLSLVSAEPARFADRRELGGVYVKSSGRLELANWLVDPGNPLTARVMVNRIWHHLFGAGLVGSVDNLGRRGESPSHPALLDYLAARFMERDWSIKRLIREIVLTKTYQQASHHNPAAHEVDPENRLLWRANRRRLEAEAFRDSLLSVSGRLDRTRGGPSLPLDSPKHIKFSFPQFLTSEAILSEETLARRTIYLPTLRKSQFEQLDVLNLFDFPDPNQANGARSVTTVPTQGLYLMNSPFLRDQARLTAQSLMQKKGLDDPARVRYFFLRALSRPVTESELVRALEFLSDFEKELASLPERPDNPRMEAWARYCHALFVSNEFLFRG